MKFDPDKHHRRSIRLKEYDYSQPGAYFITICTKDRGCALGEISNGNMYLNNAGQIVQSVWGKLPNRFEGTGLDAFVIMPNHIHGIITVGAIHELPLHPHRRKMLIPKVIGYFKMNTAKQINQLRDTTGTPLWQRNYYEHIIRNEEALAEIRQYITNNPVRWENDEENPTNITVQR